MQYLKGEIKEATAMIKNIMYTLYACYAKIDICEPYKPAILIEIDEKHDAFGWLSGIVFTEENSIPEIPYEQKEIEDFITYANIINVPADRDHIIFSCWNSNMSFINVINKITEDNHYKDFIWNGDIGKCDINDIINILISKEGQASYFFIDENYNIWIEKKTNTTRMETINHF